MNLFQKIIIIVFIIGFPFVSYYYLKMGFNIRKDALDHLKNEIPFNTSQTDLISNIDTSLFSKWSKEVLIIHRVKDDNLDEMHKFAEYLKGRNDFNILALTSDAGSIVLQDTSYSSVITKAYFSENEINEIMDSNVDNQLCYKLKKRSSYQSTQEGIGLLYKHTIILLPVKKRDKLNLKRENEF